MWAEIDVDESESLDPEELANFCTALHISTEAAKAEAEAARLERAAADLLIRQAREKFAELDIDKSGYLEGEELLDLGGWVWMTFHPDDEGVSERLAQKLGRTVIQKYDGDDDGNDNGDSGGGGSPAASGGWAGRESCWWRWQRW